MFERLNGKLEKWKIFVLEIFLFSLFHNREITLLLSLTCKLKQTVGEFCLLLHRHVLIWTYDLFILGKTAKENKKQLFWMLEKDSAQNCHSLSKESDRYGINISIKRQIRRLQAGKFLGFTLVQRPSGCHHKHLHTAISLV